MKDKSVLLLFLVLLLSVGAAFGGYYLGKYLDTKALESKSVIDNANIVEWNKYSGRAFEIIFTYPQGWSVSELKEKDNKDRDVDRIIVKSPNGSEVVISSTPEIKDSEKYELYCDKALPEGDNNKVQNCVFIQENDYSLGRFIPLDGIKDDVTTWYVTSTIKDNKYVWDNKKNVVYNVKDDADIDILDSISLGLDYIND